MVTPRSSRKIVVLQSLLLTHVVLGCSVCRDGASMPQGDKRLPVKLGGNLTEVSDCETLELISSLVPDDESSDCESIQMLGTFCGCPIPETACRLCGDDDEIRTPDMVLDRETVQLTAPDLIATVDPTTVFTCGMYDAYLSSSIDRRSEACSASEGIRNLCRCSIDDSEGNSQIQNATNSTTPPPPLTTDDPSCIVCPEGEALKYDVPLSHANLSMLLENLTSYSTISANNTHVCPSLEALATQVSSNSTECRGINSFVKACGGCVKQQHDDDNNSTTPPNAPPSVSGEDICTMCPGGEPVPYRDLLFDFPEQVPSCGVLDDVGRGIYHKDSQDCKDLKAFAKLCGCKMPQDSCSLCRPGDTMTYPNNKYAWANQGQVAENTFGSDENILSDPFLTCQAFDSILASQNVQGDQVCFAFQLRGASCGCPNPQSDWTILTKRVTASLSVLGSLTIMVDVLSDQKRRSSANNQFLLGVSFFDTVGSCINLLGSIPIPSYSGVVGARGTRATCQAAGFFGQLGFTSIFFNLCLSMHFWLTICLRWKQARQRKFKEIACICAVAIGLGLAFGGLPYYEFGITSCQIFPPPLAPSWIPAIFFFIVPMSVALGGTTLFTLLVLLEVQKREQSTNKYNFRASITNDTVVQNFFWTRKVFWKSFWYLLAFWVTYAVNFALYFVDVDGNDYWLVLLSSVLNPLQGFWNCIIYWIYRNRGKKRRRSSQPAWGGRSSFRFLSSSSESRPNRRLSSQLSIAEDPKYDIGSMQEPSIVCSVDGQQIPPHADFRSTLRFPMTEFILEASTSAGLDFSGHTGGAFTEGSLSQHSGREVGARGDEMMA